MEANSGQKSAEGSIKRYFVRINLLRWIPTGVARSEEETGMQRSQNIGQGAMGIGIMGGRQVTPRWENDPVWLHDGSIREHGQGRVREQPPRGKSGGGQRRVERVKKN